MTEIEEIKQETESFTRWWHSDGLHCAILENLGNHHHAAKRLAQDAWRAAIKSGTPSFVLGVPGVSDHHNGTTGHPNKPTRAGKGGLRENTELLVPLYEADIKRLLIILGRPSATCSNQPLRAKLAHALEGGGK